MEKEATTIPLMHTIHVSELIGTPNAILHTFGIQVYEVALTALEKADRLVIDLTNLRNITSSFFHASVGNLYRDLGEAYFQKIVLKGMETRPDWQEKIQEALELVRNPKRVSETELAIASLFEDE